MHHEQSGGSVENESKELKRQTSSITTEDDANSASSSSSSLRDLYLKDVTEGDLHGDDPAWRRVHPNPLAINGPEIPPRLRQQRQHRHHATGNDVLPPPDAPPAPPLQQAPPEEYDPAQPTPYPDHPDAAAAAAANERGGVNGADGGGGSGGRGGRGEVLDGDDQGSRLLERAFVLIGQEMIGHRTKLGKGVFLVCAKNAFVPVKRDNSMNTFSRISTVPRGSERSE